MHLSRLLFFPAVAVVTALTLVPFLEARSVQAAPDKVIEVRARLRFATVVVLPAGERILDWVCGDADYWSVQGEANLAFVKPTASGIRTNVTLVTDRGNIYTFLFRELGDAEGDPDLQLFVDAVQKDGEQAARLAPVRFEERGAADLLEARLEAVREETRLAVQASETRADEAIADFRSTYPASLAFDYVLDRRSGEAPFHVRAMWHDGRFTYIRAQPEEAPALYEERDGKPSMVPYDFAEGLYVTGRPIADGWLQIGNRKLRFWRVRR